MKAIRTVIGLIYDDPWVFFGILVALLVGRVLISIGITGAPAEIVMTLLLFAAMAMSVWREVRRSLNKT